MLYIILLFSFLVSLNLVKGFHKSRMALSRVSAHLATTEPFATSNSPKVAKPEHFDKIYNFRRLFTEFPGVPLYRSAAFDNATAADAARLLTDINISTIIDLRNRDEVLKHGVFRTFDGATAFYSDFTTAPSASYPRSMLPTRLRYELPLLDDLQAFWEGVEARVGAQNGQDKLRLSMLWLFDGKKLMRELSSALAAQGFPLMYTVMMEVSAAKICSVLQVILTSLEDGKATVFHCAQGKDRTGKAIILSIMLQYLLTPSHVFFQMW